MTRQALRALRSTRAPRRIEKVIPEKTIELWTAFSLLDRLGQDTWIWSRTSYVDQDVWDGDIKKWFVLELKAPEINVFNYNLSPWINISMPQLDHYVTGFLRNRHPDVLYVLPDPPWTDPPYVPSSVRYPVPPDAAHPHNRRSFDKWSYVIRATTLKRLLGPNPPKRVARVRCHAGEVQYTGLRDQTNAQAVESLRRFLVRVLLCDEPMGTNLRAKEIVRTPRPDQESQEEFGEDLLLTNDAIRGAIEWLESGESGHLMYVGLP